MPINYRKIPAVLVPICGILLMSIGGGYSAHAASPSVSVVDISPGTTIAIGTTVTFAISTTGFVDPAYQLSDAFEGGSLGNLNVSQAGEVSWTPYNNDLGTHVITLSASDTLRDTASTTLTITVVQNTSQVPSTTASASSESVTIQSLSPSSTVIPGQTISFTAVPSGFSNTPTYSVTDSLAGSSVSGSTINSYGDFLWTPSTNDIGTHVITVNADDTSTGNVSHASVTIQVQSAPAAVSTPVVTAPAVSAASSVASPTTTFTEELQSGSTGAEVTALQQVLAAQGDFTGTVTGYFGAETKDAVIKFQAAHGIEQLGIVGPSTRAALNALGATATPAVSTTASTATPASSSTVSEIQTEIQSILTEISQIESQVSTL